MQIYTESRESQFLSEVPSTANRKIGVEIVRSADVGQRRYRGVRPGRGPISPRSELSRRDLYVLLSGQLRWLREQIERGNPIPIDSVRRAERIAQNLQCEESAA